MIRCVARPLASSPYRLGYENQPLVSVGEHGGWRRGKKGLMPPRCTCFRNPLASNSTVRVKCETLFLRMWSKMNVLHLHLTDSQSIPIEFPSIPEVTQNGAYSAEEVYSLHNMAALVRCAPTPESDLRTMPSPRAHRSRANWT
jgi:hypothetical protein